MPDNVMNMNKKCSYSHTKNLIFYRNYLTVSTFSFGTILVSIITRADNYNL